MKNIYSTICIIFLSSSIALGQIFTDNFGAYPNNADLSTISSWQHDGVGSFTNKVNATFGAMSSNCFGQLTTIGAASAYVDFPVTAGNTYVFKAYLKTTNNMIYSTIKIKSGGVNGTEVGTPSGNVSSNYSWQELQTEYTPTANETATFSIEKSQGQTLNIDKVKIICSTCPENTLVYDFQDSKESWISGGGSSVVLGTEALIVKAFNNTPVARSGGLTAANFAASSDYNTAKITFKTPYAASGAGVGKLFFYSNAAGNAQFATFNFDRDAANTTTFQTATVDLTAAPAAGSFNDSIARIGIRGPWGVANGDTVFIQKIELYNFIPPPALELTGIMDFDIPSNGGKAFHLTAVADEADISSYGIGIANNGGGTDGQEITLPAIAVTTGDDILLVRDSAAMVNYFGTCMSEFEHVIVIGGAINHNGDDATELFQNGAVIETYGDINVDGTGEVWDYEDSWAYKDNGSWTYGGANCSDGSTTTQTSSCPYPLCPLPPPSDLVITTEVCNTSGGDVVRLTGPWWSWDPLGGPVANDNGDGTYTFTFSPAPTTDMEYLLVLNGVQEDMVAAGTSSADWSCTPVTDYFSYANRQWTVGSGDTVNNVYGQCSSVCSSVIGLELTGIIDFDIPSNGGKAFHLTAVSDESDISSYGIGIANNGGGTDGQEITLPAIAVTTGDDILLVRDSAAMASYFGACMSEFEHVIVIGSSINHNGDDATELFQNGVVIETYGDINTDGTGEVWDYEDSWAYKDNGSWTYGGANCSDGSSNTQTSSCPYPLCPPLLSDLIITTEVCGSTGGDTVRLTGPWWSWDPLGGPVATDNGDGTYTFTFSPAPTGDMEYLLVLNGIQEDMVTAGTSSGDWSCTPVTDYFSYANRQWTVGSGDTVANVYGQCGPCSAAPVTDLTITTEVCGSTVGDTVRLTGPWWSWDPLGGPVATDNGDGTYTFTFSPAPTSDMEYLLVLNGVQEDMVTAGTNSGDWSCTPVTDYFSYANRQWTVGSADTVTNVYGQCSPCSAAPVSDLTITTEVCGNFGGSTVRLTGPWWNWDPNGGPVAADNGDGTYTFTFSPAPTSDMEYLLVLDGVQEDMVAAGTSSGDWSCTPVTDYFSYANRQWTIGSGDTVNNVYGQCSPCGPVVSGTLMIQGVMDFDLPTPNPPVSGAQGKALHFKVDGAIADLSTFGVGVANNGGGTDGQEYTFPAIAASSGDEILLARDTGSISSYFGTCFDQFDIVLVATGSISQNGDDAIELYNNGAVIDIFGDVNVDGSGEPWEYLDSWAYRSSSSADTAFTVSDWQYGGVNCTDGDSLIANSACIYPICQPNILNITVEVCSGMADTVRLTGPFWSWDPNGGPIGTDNGNGTWTFEFNPAPSANMEYLFVVDGVQEDLISAMVNGGTCAPVTDYFSYANRLWEVGDPDVTDAVYGQCDPCTGGPAMVDVTFQVDMTNAIGAVNFTTPEVQGEWNWAGGGVSMTDSNNDNTWECVKSLAVGDTIEYIFAADNFAVQETLDSSFSCVIATVDGGVLYVNRFVVVPSSDVTLDPVCWESCDPCVVGINSGEMPFARIFPNPASNNLTVQSENGLDKLIIRDMLGRIVIELDNVTPNNLTIDLSSFSNDIYLVELYKGDNKSTKKLIVMQ